MGEKGGSWVNVRMTEIVPGPGYNLEITQIQKHLKTTVLGELLLRAHLSSSLKNSFVNEVQVSFRAHFFMDNKTTQLDKD